MTMYPKKDEDEEEDEEEEDAEEEQSEKALAAYNSGQVKKKCFRWLWPVGSYILDVSAD